jgi:hypothetical protein
MSKEAAYKATGHKYNGRNTGRGGRENSKIFKAMKGVASFDLLDAIARDDARRRNEQRTNDTANSQNTRH